MVLRARAKAKRPLRGGSGRGRDWTWRAASGIGSTLILESEALPFIWLGAGRSP